MDRTAGIPSLPRPPISLGPVINKVLDVYGQLSSIELNSFMYLEAPWRNARKGLEPSRRGSVEITHAAIARQYRNGRA